MLVAGEPEALYNQHKTQRKNKKNMEKLTNIKGRLLEGCIWDEREQKLFFVDIECRKIHCFCFQTNTLSYIDMPGMPGCIVLEEAGTLIAALPDGLYRVSFLHHSYKRIMKTELPEGIRFNDGKCDADGNLWVGSMAITQDERARGAGALYCIKKDQRRKIYKGYSIPNGLAWDRTGTYFYHIDTPEKRVDRYFVTEGAVLSDKETAIDLSQEEGSPDGMCMDSHGRLWIAMWGGNKVVCADTLTGEVTEELQVPDKNVSCCTFGGPQMDILFVTTAQDEAGNGGEVYMHQMKEKGVEAERYGR